MPELRTLLWDDYNIAHIADHKIEPSEVHEVVFAEATVFAIDDSHRRGRLIAQGATSAGRMILVVLEEPTSTGESYVVTARPMTDRERQAYQEWGENQ